METEIQDIIDCILEFDENETLQNKGEYFGIIQRDLKKALEQPKAESLQGEEKITIPKWQFKQIEDVLRQTNNIHHSQKQETCFDRCICKAWKWACDALGKEYGFEQSKEVEMTEQPNEEDYCGTCMNYDDDSICNKCDDSFCVYKKTEQPVSAGIICKDKNIEDYALKNYGRLSGMTTIGIIITALTEYAQSHPIDLRKELIDFLLKAGNYSSEASLSFIEDEVDEHLKSRPESKTN